MTNCLGKAALTAWRRLQHCSRSPSCSRGIFISHDSVTTKTSAVCRRLLDGNGVLQLGRGVTAQLSSAGTAGHEPLAFPHMASTTLPLGFNYLQRGKLQRLKFNIP